MDLPVHIFKHMDQILEAPQIDPRFRFIKYGHPGASCHDGGDFDPLHFSAGKTCIDLSVNIVLCAQPYLREVLTGSGDCNIFPGCQPDQIKHGDAFKTYRLLKGIADAPLCPLRDVQVRDVLTIQIKSSLCGLLNTRDDFCQR